MLSFKLLATLALSSISFCAQTSDQAPSATIDSGVVIGTATLVSSAASATIVNKFLGVPFAASPTRFAPPATATPWTTPFNATRYGHTCPQQFNYPEADRNYVLSLFDTPPPRGSENEDCLNVNVYVPATPTQNKPVMVWIFGGGLAFGSNSLALYDGTSFAANQDVILVSINYRTGVFGFPGTSLLPSTATNIGFLDQRFALQWVQRNIHAFGGSPDKVLIFGESAGSVSVDALVLTNPTSPPFRAAIGQSGVADYFVSINRDTSLPWDNMVKNLSCADDVLACVRAANTSTIVNYAERNGIPFYPVVDNFTLPATPDAWRAAGKGACVPWMTGTNANEARAFFPVALNTTTYLETVFKFNSSTIKAVESLYPIPSLYINDSLTQLSQLYTDFQFQCPAAVAFNGTHDAGIPAYRYLYNATFPNLEPRPELGVWHNSEIALVFGTYPQANATKEQEALSKYMQTAWASFAKNPEKGPGWAAWPTMAVLGPMPGPKGYNGIGMRYNVKVTGPLGRAVDRTCGLWKEFFETS